MGWKSQAVIAQLVIIEGPGDGLFVYDGTPALGSLVQSVTPMAGTDPYGNAYLQGDTNYEKVGSGYVATNVNNARIQFYEAATFAGPWTAEAIITGRTSSPPAGQTVLSVTQGAVAVNNASFTVASLGGIREWYPPSGGDDFAAIQTGLTNGSADLTPGIFLLSADLVPAGASLTGLDMATVLSPYLTYAGVLATVSAKGSIRNLSFQGGGTDAVQVSSGIAEWWLEDLYFASNTGLCINAPSITGATHGRIRGIRGAGGSSANGGGIALNGGTAGAITAEINISDIDIQNCTASEVLFLSAVTDVLVNKVNGSIKSGVSANGITVQGACQTIELRELDVGGGSGTGVLVFQKAGTNSPSDVFAEGKVQDGAIGCVVADASARLTLQMWADRNQGDGFQLTNTGAFNVLDKCGGNNNNQAAGTAYDLNITSTGHWLVDSFRGVSGGVTANRNITSATNHVTVVNDPSGTTTAGNTPGGW